MSDQGTLEDKDYSVKVINTRNPLNPFQRKVNLGEDIKKTIEDDLYKIYKDWDGNVGQLRSKIQRWVHNSEGTSTVKDTPWRGASAIFKPITETRINIIHSFFMSVVRPRMGRLFKCITDNKVDKKLRDLCRSVEQFFNSNNAFNVMYVSKLSEAYWAVLRDGTIQRTLDWNKKVERRWEMNTYNSLDEFMQKFPTPEVAGMKEESYFKLIEDLTLGIPVTLDEEFDEIVTNMPLLDYEEIKDSVWSPVNAKDQDQTVFLGKVLWMRKPEIVAKEKMDGIFSNTADVVSQVPAEDEDTVTKLQDSIEGISNPSEKSFHKIIHGRYKRDLDGDGIEEKYLVTFAVDEKKILQFDKFPFYHGNDNSRISGFKKRSKRLLYRGAAEMLDDLNEEANIAARQRIDARAITNSPQFKAADTLKMILDPRRPENKFRPGGIWWMPPNMMDKIEQVKVDKRDFGDSMGEEDSLNQAADNILGASELRSGRETPNDPRAPAAKTAMLLNQSSIRLDDFLHDFIINENKLLDDVLKLYYQYHPEPLKFYVENVNQADRHETGEEFTESIINTKDLNSKDIHLQLSFTSILENPEFLRAAWEEFYVKYNQEPMLLAIPEIRHKVISEIITNTPEAIGKGILKPLQEIVGQNPVAGSPMALGGGMEGVGANPPVNPTLQNAMASPNAG